jgi:hypothetical protein
MSRIDDIFNGPIKRALAATSLSAHAFAATGGATATVQTTGAIVSQIGGVTRSRAALSAQSLAPTHDIFGNANTSVYAQPANTTVYYVLGVNAAGTVAIVQGTFAGQNLVPPVTAGVGALANSGTSFVGDGSIPNLPEGFAPAGLLKVVTTTGAGVPFTPGTTNLNAAGLALTFWDINLIPEGRP